MKRLAAFLTIALLAVAMPLILRSPVAANAPEAEAGAASDRLVVHEWGTFTTFSGSDGVRLEFRPLVENDLPGFVFDRATQSGQQNPFLKGRIRTTVRMETPVTYFYTDRERDVKVSVGFPKGLLTEFYPPVARMEPPFHWPTAMNGEKIGDSRLDWGTVHLIPVERLQTRIENDAVASRVQQRLFDALVPPSPLDNHYGYARETDSALVHVVLPADANRQKRPPDDGQLILDPLAAAWAAPAFGPRGAFFEKFLFYRGVGKFDLPLKLESLKNGEFRLTNSGPDEVRSLFLVSVRGEAIHFRQWSELKPGAAMLLEKPSAHWPIDALGLAVEAALVREGLYEKEARAMVKTWKSSWFGEQGTRLFYVVPRTLTDAVLPLTIEPAPQETIRVLVGRMEILSTEDEAQMIEVVRRSAMLRAEFATLQQASVAEGKEPPRYPLPEEIEKLGRLAEPALVRLRTIAKEDAVKYEAAALLQELAAEKQVAP